MPRILQRRSCYRAKSACIQLLTVFPKSHCTRPHSNPWADQFIVYSLVRFSSSRYNHSLISLYGLDCAVVHLSLLLINRSLYLAFYNLLCAFFLVSRAYFMAAFTVEKDSFQFHRRPSTVLPVRSSQLFRPASINDGSPLSITHLGA